MQNGAATIDLDDPSETQTCDLWYARDIYEIFDLLITFTPYFLILMSCISAICVYLFRKCVCSGQQIRRAGTRNQRRILLSLHLFLLWFVSTWSPWVLYDFFQTILNLTYSVYIDAITTFVVYLNYTFSSLIVLITIKELRHFCLKKFGFRPDIPAFHQRVIPIQTVGPTRTVRYLTEGHHIAIISKHK